jgi:integrase
MEAYLSAHEQQASAERAHYAAKRLYEAFGDIAMTAITPASIEAYNRQRAAAGAAPATIRRELGVLSAAARWCQQALGWQVTDPTTGRRPPATPGRLRWLSREEADRLIAAARQSTSHALADFITLALHTGMRRGELLGLEWERVDLGRACLYLDTQHQKNRQRSTIPLNSAARAALIRLGQFRAQHCPASPWVFCHADGRRIQKFRHSFTHACEQAGITDFTIHDLRHTCASWLVQAGVPIAEVCALLRHGDIRMTMRYAHLEPGNVRAAVERLVNGPDKADEKWSKQCAR